VRLKRSAQFARRGRLKQPLGPLDIIGRWAGDLKNVAEQELESQLDRWVPSLDRYDWVVREAVAQVERCALERCP
jgi:hypothetical protein